MQEIVRVIPKNSLEEVRVELVTYKGHDLVGIRVYSDFSKSKEMLPTRKGVTVQVGLIAELIEGLQEAKRKAEENGVLKH
jgi:Transcriptional Coactivator p15 (PC4)